MVTSYYSFFPARIFNSQEAEQYTFPKYITAISIYNNLKNDIYTYYIII